jgi:para-nitrobenzyl esterase
MKPSISAAALAAAFGLMIAPAAFAQAPPPPANEVSISKLAINLLPADKGAKLKVTSPAFKDMTDIPYENTQYRGNIFPGLEWSKGPKGTQSYVLIMQDTDGNHAGDAILHFTMYNIPSSITKLDAGMTSPPPAAEYGPNVRGPHNAFMGPRTPPGPKHRYHLQIFALDTVLEGDPGLTWDQLKASLNGHVLASGQTIGLGSADPTAPPRKPAG